MTFGPGDQDYFWINDLQPVMIMHPYSKSLEGENIGSIATALKQMKENLLESVQKESDIAENLAAASEELSASSQEMKMNSKDVSKAVEDISEINQNYFQI